jgi:hypothetical protein
MCFDNFYAYEDIVIFCCSVFFGFNVNFVEYGACVDLGK